MYRGARPGRGSPSRSRPRTVCRATGIDVTFIDRTCPARRLSGPPGALGASAPSRGHRDAPAAPRLYLGRV